MQNLLCILSIYIFFTYICCSFLQNQFEHSPNCQIRTESEILKQIKFKESLCSCTCDQCGAVTTIPAEHQLRMENERLKKEYAKLLSTARKFGFAEK